MTGTDALTDTSREELPRWSVADLMAEYDRLAQVS